MSHIHMQIGTPWIKVTCNNRTQGRDLVYNGRCDNNNGFGGVHKRNRYLNIVCNPSVVNGRGYWSGRKCMHLV